LTTAGEKTADRPIEEAVSGIRRAPAFEHNIFFVAKGGGVTFAGKMFLAAVRFVTAVLLARLLGAEQFGMYSLALSAANIAIGLAIFGLDTALVRYIAVLVSRRDEKGVWGTIQVGIGTAMVLSVITGTLLYALAFPVAQQLFNEPRLTPLLQLVSVIVPVLVLSEVLAGANRGFKRMEYPVIAQFVFQPIIRLVLIAGLAFFGFNATYAILTFGLADLAASIILIYFLNKEFGLKRPLRDARRDFREIFTFSIPVGLSEMMVKFHNNIQTLLLGTLNTITGVGIFTVASQITMVSGQFSSSINTSAKPVIAELHDRGDLKQLGRIYQTTNKWSVMVQLPVFLVLVLFPEQILSIFGRSFTDGATALAILAFADLIHVVTGMGGSIIDMTGHTKLKLVNSIIRLVLFLTLNVLFIPGWGIIGAALAALIGELVINLIRLLQVYILFRLIPYNRSFIRPLTAGLLALVSAMIVGIWFPPENSVPYTIVNIAVLLIVYAGFSLLLGFSPEERIMLAQIRQRARTVLSRLRR
jgi:O-antigen/teichoic acid export membrane protein